MKTISVANIRNPRSIVKAFQEAIDAVITREKVNKVINGRADAEEAQSIHWKRGRPAMGTVTMFLQSDRKAMLIFVTIHQGHAPTDNAPLPTNFVKRIRLQFEGRQGRVELKWSDAKKHFEAKVSCPTDWILTAPRLKISLA